MSTTWTGWLDGRPPKHHPAWWYETRRVGSDGEPVNDLLGMFGGTRQYRKRDDATIARMTVEREQQTRDGDIAFGFLPRLALDAPCPKCGAGKWQVQYAPCTDDALGRYGAHPYMVVGCKRCGHTFDAQPLDAGRDA